MFARTQTRALRTGFLKFWTDDMKDSRYYYAFNVKRDMFKIKGEAVKGDRVMASVVCGQFTINAYRVSNTHHYTVSRC